MEQLKGAKFIEMLFEAIPQSILQSCAPSHPVLPPRPAPQACPPL